MMPDLNTPHHAFAFFSSISGLIINDTLNANAPSETNKKKSLTDKSKQLRHTFLYY
jgi:hypothetical protein